MVFSFRAFDLSTKEIAYEPVTRNCQRKAEKVIGHNVVDLDSQSLGESRELTSNKKGKGKEQSEDPPMKIHFELMGDAKIEKHPIEGGNESKLTKRRAKREASRVRENSAVGQLAVPIVVSALLELAVDPFYGIERDLPLIVRRVFLRFRSLVYSPSLVLPAPTTSKSQPNKVKPTELVKTSGVNPTNDTKKRAPLDRQEEISAKRLKKVHQLKSLTQKTSDGGPKETNLEFEPVLPLSPRKESPTFLIMKFPPKSTLPSIWNLKARFARFGPLELNSTRVFWKTHSCRVQFKYKPDALNALNFVKSSDTFGQIQVECSVREVEPSRVVPSRSNAEKLRLIGFGVDIRLT